MFSNNQSKFKYKQAENNSNPNMLQNKDLRDQKYKMTEVVSVSTNKGFKSSQYKSSIRENTRYNNSNKGNSVKMKSP